MAAASVTPARPVASARRRTGRRSARSWFETRAGRTCAFVSSSRTMCCSECPGTALAAAVAEGRTVDSEYCRNRTSTHPLRRRCLPCLPPQCRCRHTYARSMQAVVEEEEEGTGRRSAHSWFGTRVDRTCTSSSRTMCCSGCPGTALASTVAEQPVVTARVERAVVEGAMARAVAARAGS